MVLVYNQFRLTTVIEAAMEIAGMQAAQKRLHVRTTLFIHASWCDGVACDT